ncbi:hypothetical protein J31TS6_26510 [Brevibacillus reuszeri]|uniref:DUF5682 family protein n=1 Tax=Brevibacillus reuszeri TaxID=54915 RepID=UPI001B26EA75|nr:DUF5682 family protein [Brevibacillus reuszeri]GIO06623.1 hypothetical protein J31TS6_26510 [Brevibacillus reuszeri]
MGSLLQREEMDQINKLAAEEVYNLNKQVVYFPIRHHSPACSFHLKKTIEAYQPTIILIEGPDNSNHLIPILVNDQTQPPVSIYYAYTTEERKYVCYFPFLSYSPEYVALLEAKRLQIPAAFIDLGYGSRLESLEDGHDLKKHNEKQSYHDERMLSGSSFIQQLCTTLKCRNFDELWEKVFEIEGIRKTTADFVKEVFAYCYLSRKCYDDAALEAEGDLIREAHMRKKIEEAKHSHDRILVVTGGFHTYGLIENRSTTYTVKKAKEEKVYPMVYTYQEADQLNGYASGMPFVHYYENVWQALEKKESAPFTKSALAYLPRLLKKLRDKDESNSTADAIEAYSLMSGLALIREKSEGGAYELLDSVLSAFTKGERSIATNQPIEALRELMTGDGIGQVAKNDLDVPIVRDCKEKCKTYKLQISTTGRNQKILELYAKKTHRQASHFFHCMQFLGTEFCQKEAGPDWMNYKHVNLVRETWRYGYSSYVEARLIEASIYGGTVQEAAAQKLEDMVKELPQHQSHELAKWLLQAIVMGLEELAERLFEQVEQSVKQDGHFLSLCQTLKVLTILHEQKRLFGLKETARLERLVDDVYYEAVTKIALQSNPHPDEWSQVAEQLKFLYTISEQKQTEVSREIFSDQLQELLHSDQLPANLVGVVTAILCNLEVLAREEVSRRARAYMLGTPDQILHTAPYLQGVFLVARDYLFYEDALLNDLNQMISSISYDEFVQVVPELRLAFTYFSPMEIIMLSEKVAALFETPVEDVLSPFVDEKTMREASRLDLRIKEEFAKWNLI